MSADNQDAKRVVSSDEDAIRVSRDREKGHIGRRRLVVTGLAAPVIVTLGSRSAQAQSHGGSHMSSIAGATKKK